jgi:hypothetical protein
MKSDDDIAEILVLHCQLSADSVLWVYLEHLLKQVDPLFGHQRQELFKILLFPLRKRYFEVREVFYARPLVS